MTETRPAPTILTTRTRKGLDLVQEQRKRSLVIVESPTKARTIRRFLPGGFEVEASMGHVRDLPASAAEIPDEVKDKEWARLGVDVGAGFKPVYVISSGKKKVVTGLRAAL